MNKLAIIVPYRNRKEHLEKFIPYLKTYLNRNSSIDYTIIVVHQDDIKKFNRGKLLNIGFLEAEKLGVSYVIFHDIDLLPVHGSYEYSDKPLQLANKFRSYSSLQRTIQRDYFGGVTLFNTENFRKINGYSNKYRGWGFEDNDLLYRCREQNLPLDEISYRTPYLDKQALNFNGKNSYVKIDNKIKFARPFSFVISFYPDKIFCDPNEITDEYTVFGIPGFDLNLSYNSFSTYKFELFLTNNVAVSINTEHTPNIPARVVVTVDPKRKIVEFYFNGKKIYDKKYADLDWQKSGIYKYAQEPYLYLGAANPERKNKPKYYKGYIDSFAVYNRLLSTSEIREINSNVSDHLLTEGLSEAEIKENFCMYFDTRYIIDNKLKDLSGNNTPNVINNCNITHLTTNNVYTVKMPIRRPVTYSLLHHEEGGYTEGYWVDWSSRKNQLYYHNLVHQGSSNFRFDGLSTCRYRLKNTEKKDNVIYIDVRT